MFNDLFGNSYLKYLFEIYILFIIYNHIYINFL